MRAGRIGYVLYRSVADTIMGIVAVYAERAFEPAGCLQHCDAHGAEHAIHRVFLAPIGLQDEMRCVRNLARHATADMKALPSDWFGCVVMGGHSAPGSC